MLRKVISTVILHRKGVQEVFEPGAFVDLTEKEYNDLRAINPGCIQPLSEAELALVEKQEAASAPAKPAKQAAKAAKPVAEEKAADSEGEL